MNRWQQGLVYGSVAVGCMTVLLGLSIIRDDANIAGVWIGLAGTLASFAGLLVPTRPQDSSDVSRPEGEMTTSMKSSATAENRSAAASSYVENTISGSNNRTHNYFVASSGRPNRDRRRLLLSLAAVVCVTLIAVLVALAGPWPSRSHHQRAPEIPPTSQEQRTDEEKTQAVGSLTPPWGVEEADTASGRSLLCGADCGALRPENRAQDGTAEADAPAARSGAGGRRAAAGPNPPHCEAERCAVRPRPDRQPRPDRRTGEPERDRPERDHRRDQDRDRNRDRDRDRDRDRGQRPDGRDHRRPDARAGSQRDERAGDRRGNADQAGPRNGNGRAARDREHRRPRRQGAARPG